MKFSLLGLLLFGSIQAMALTCKTVDLPLKVISIQNLDDGAVSAKLIDVAAFEEKTFVGIVDSIFLSSTYDFQSKHWGNFSFQTNKVFGGIGHCRTRVCDEPTKTIIAGKLIVDGYEDEYFTCI